MEGDDRPKDEEVALLRDRVRMLEITVGHLEISLRKLIRDYGPQRPTTILMTTDDFRFDS